jgi:hypothetical protein
MINPDDFYELVEEGFGKDYVAPCGYCGKPAKYFWTFTYEGSWDEGYWFVCEECLND